MGRALSRQGGSEEDDLMSFRASPLQIAVWFLAVTYGVAAPFTVVLEYQGQLLSERFNYPGWLIYLTCLVQVLCVIGVLFRATRVWAVVVLTIITVGAVGSHVRIGSPETAGGALVYSAIQVWVGWKSRDA